MLVLLSHELIQAEGLLYPEYSPSEWDGAGKAGSMSQQWIMKKMEN